MHKEIDAILNSNQNNDKKIAQLKRLAFDTAEKQVADEENMHNKKANGEPDIKEIVDALNKLSGKKYKVSDFYPHA